MPSKKGKASGKDLSGVLEGLVHAGGLAAVVQGAPVTTMGVDIVHERSPGNITRLPAFLRP